MWSTTHALDVHGVTAQAVWDAAYVDSATWPQWNRALASARLDGGGSLAEGAVARVRFRTGLRLAFTIVAVDPGRAFTDEARLPGARMGHRHELEPLGDDDGVPGVRLRNTIYVDGPAAWFWGPLLGPLARRGLPGWQRAAAELAAAVGH